MSIEEIIEESIERGLKKHAELLADAQQPIVVTLEEAARLLSCTPRQVRNLVHQGVLTPTRWPGEDRKRPRPYFLRSELVDAAKRHQSVKE